MSGEIEVVEQRKPDDAPKSSARNDDSQNSSTSCVPNFVLCGKSPKVTQPQQKKDVVHEKPLMDSPSLNSAQSSMRRRMGAALSKFDKRGTGKPETKTEGKGNNGTTEKKQEDNKSEVKGEEGHINDPVRNGEIVTVPVPVPVPEKKDEVNKSEIKEEGNVENKEEEGHISCEENGVGNEEIMTVPDLTTAISGLKEAVDQLTNAITKNFEEDPLDKHYETLCKAVQIVAVFTTAGSFYNPPGGLDTYGHIRFRRSAGYKVYHVLSDLSFLLAYVNLVHVLKPVSEENRESELKLKIAIGWAVLWLTVILFLGSFVAAFWVVYPDESLETWPRWFTLGTALLKVVWSLVFLFGMKCWRIVRGWVC
ncbi:hypothetical protein CARUB_v10020519mg [Capsella rubella]|uniref:PGG domain-containing protein n=1 Tax=Capsella rubella TaxID=81985 RepID=R0IB15_9BRAS|nr:uncharacterized protein LOC17894907 [Capsella rubella]EOA35335.1 hypothetical protein CARUB_v10020519mg [Capsella rubella]